MLDLLLPPRCPVCRRSGPAPCSACLAALPAPPALPPPAAVDRCVPVVAYAGAGRALVHALKFRRERAAVAWVAAALAARLDAGGFDVVTWVPTTRARARRRGGDHAERLARALAAASGVPVRRLLLRRHGPPQAGRSAAARRGGPPLAPARSAPPAVLLVDDVVTTGASVSAAARVLRAAGARTVTVACAGRTPPRSRSHAEWREILTQGGRAAVRNSAQMVHSTPASDVPDGLLETLLDGPVLSPDRIAAGRIRAAGAPVDPVALADAVVAEAGRAPAASELVRD